MKRYHLATALVILWPQLAAAESHKLLVLQSEGRASARVRAKIDAAINKLAAAAEPSASPGEPTVTDAATAVGCKPSTASCKEEVIGMLAVDEIVITTVTPRRGGVEITVHRIARGGTSRDATMLLPTGSPPDKLDGIATVFDDRSAPAVPFGPPGPPPAGPAPAAPAPAIAAVPPADDEQPVVPAPTTVAPAPQPVPEIMPASATPVPRDQPAAPNRRLQLVGIAGGTGMVVLGLVLWGAASGVQADIDSARTATRQDLSNLRDLESRGDTYAALGNVLTVGGVVIGGIATFLYLRDRRPASTTSARLVPTVLDHGAGLVLTIGGMP